VVAADVEAEPRRDQRTVVLLVHVFLLPGARLEAQVEPDHAAHRAAGVAGLVLGAHADLEVAARALGVAGLAQAQRAVAPPRAGEAGAELGAGVEGDELVD
jgi:hypothetical protein